VKANQAIKTPSQFKITLGLAKYTLKASLRNRGSFIFGLVFPLIFVSVFGLIGNGSNKTEIGVADTVSQTNPLYTAIKKVADSEDAPIKLTSGTEVDLEEQLSHDKIASVLEANPSNPTGLTLVTSAASPSGAAASAGFLNGLVSQLNLQALQQHTGITVLPFKYSTKDIAGRSFNYIDFALPGQIGFSMLQLATFGVAFSLITLRKTLVLKRMFATTVKPISFVIALCASRSVQAVLQTVVILTVGVYAFHFTLAHGWISYVNMLILSLLGILTFLGFGIFLSNLAKDEQSLPIALNLFNLPQILLAGVFFPVDGFPKWVQYIGNNLPLAYLNTAMRKVSVEGVSLIHVWPYLAGMLAWGVIVYILAAITFKPEP
jgi:ABC-2 type transport system permease protein